MSGLLHALDTFWQTATLGDWFVVVVVFVAMASIPMLILWDQITPHTPPEGFVERELLEQYSRDHARAGLPRADLSKIVRFEPRALHPRPRPTFNLTTEDSNHVA